MQAGNYCTQNLGQNQSGNSRQSLGRSHTSTYSLMPPHIKKQPNLCIKNGLRPKMVSPNQHLSVFVDKVHKTARQLLKKAKVQEKTKAMMQRFGTPTRGLDQQEQCQNSSCFHASGQIQSGNSKELKLQPLQQEQATPKETLVLRKSQIPKKNISSSSKKQYQEKLRPRALLQLKNTPLQIELQVDLKRFPLKKSCDMDKSQTDTKKADKNPQKDSYERSYNFFIQNYGALDRKGFAPNQINKKQSLSQHIKTKYTILRSKIHTATVFPNRMQKHQLYKYKYIRTSFQQTRLQPCQVTAMTLSIRPQTGKPRLQNKKQLSIERVSIHSQQQSLNLKSTIAQHSARKNYRSNFFYASSQSHSERGFLIKNVETLRDSCYNPQSKNLSNSPSRNTDYCFKKIIPKARSSSNTKRFQVELKPWDNIQEEEQIQPVHHHLL